MASKGEDKAVCKGCETHESAKRAADREPPRTEAGEFKTDIPLKDEHAPKSHGDDKARAQGIQVTEHTKWGGT